MTAALPVDPEDPSVVYHNTVDQGAFAMLVTRGPGERQMADFRVYDVRGDDAVLLHEEKTTLIADAIFGPDVDDVAGWQTTALWHIDARLEVAP